MQQPKGFQVAQTGGGCTAFIKGNIMVTDREGCNLPLLDEPVLVGVYEDTTFNKPVCYAEFNSLRDYWRLHV